jgi:hypothetical protein
VAGQQSERLAVKAGVRLTDTVNNSIREYVIAVPTGTTLKFSIVSFSLRVLDSNGRLVASEPIEIDSTTDSSGMQLAYQIVKRSSM